MPCVINMTLIANQLGYVKLYLPKNYSSNYQILIAMCTFDGEFIIDSVENETFNASDNLIEKLEILDIYKYFHFLSNSCKFIKINLQSDWNIFQNQSVSIERAFEQFNFTSLNFSNNAIIAFLYIKDPGPMLGK